MSNVSLRCLAINSLPSLPSSVDPSLPRMKTSAVLLLCLARTQALPHHPMEDIDLENQVKEKIESDAVNIEVGEAKTRLQETGKDFLEVKKENVEELKNHVGKMLEWSNPTKLDLELQKIGEDILKKAEQEIKGQLKDIKDDLPTTVDQLVKGLSELTKSEMKAKLKQLKKVINMKVRGKFFDMCLKIWNYISAILKKAKQDFKEIIQRKVSDIEVCGAKTTLQEIGDDIINEVEQQLETNFENIKIDYLAANIDYLVQSVAPVLGWSDTEEEESKKWLHKIGEDILKKTEQVVKEKLEDIKDNLPTMVDQVVEGLLSWFSTGKRAITTCNSI